MSSNVIHLYATVYPQKLKPLKELAERFDRFDVCLCEKCRWRNSNFYPNPCQHRKNFAWKKCVHHIPIARNSFLAERVRELTRFGLSLDEAIGMMEECLKDG